MADVALRPPGSLHGAPIPVVPDVAYLRTAIVNVAFVGAPESGRWVLVDAGISGYADHIADAAARRFGDGSRPEAIVLTHGHFDHVGSLRALVERWDVPVYAHQLELPYLTGRSAYPPPDPTVGGGAMARLAGLYPKRPIDLGERVRPLADDGSLPEMPGWRWVFTPGHTPGHVSLFREADRVLIAGDAFVTTKQESALAVLTQRAEINGPPMYFTPDWERAWSSVKALAALEPLVALTGHGSPMQGPQLAEDLHALARDFDVRAMPSHGRYVGRPAVTDERGVVSLPPAPSDPVTGLALGIGAAVALGMVVRSLRGDQRGRA
ncbi:beta-lactamase domain protein [Gemmatirosa kalamazoonensis]|uniref:Beta-lactamase domain protein n=1 Tax=Gemmatirosa kalamazoonensis TaxID=861299 RepID=W0RLH4_9BACT|nr:MBL fold metallo-hydrolase [Gemmatirosa kalamazoonensis]AHG91934.1 beta-lactamase domain protein [Gemmatirosa kalamazoonensis]